MYRRFTLKHTPSTSLPIVRGHWSVGARGAVINWNRRGKQIKASCDDPGEGAEHPTVSDQTVAIRKRPCQRKRPSKS